MWIIDIRHWLNDQLVSPAEPQLRLKVKRLTEIIAWITTFDRGLLEVAVASFTRKHKEKGVESLFSRGGTVLSQ